MRGLNGFGLCFALLASVGIANGQVASVVAVGDLPGGPDNATIRGVSTNGQYVFGVSNSSNGFEAFIWTSGGGMQSLGDLPLGGFSSFANGVSNSGVAVGRGVSTSTRGFRWTSSGGMTQLPDLLSSSVSHQANAISSDGAVIVGQSNSLANGIRATTWSTLIGPVVLADLPGGTNFSDALGVNSTGEVIVGWSQSGNGREAARWVAGIVSPLGDFSGGSFDSYANAASADGSVIVGRGWDANGATAFRWTATGGMQLLGNSTIGGEAFNSEAFDVSDDGNIVVGRGNLPDFTSAFVWRAGTGMRSVRQLLQEAGADLTGWTAFNEARGISGDGRIIVGNGVYNGLITGFVATFPPSNITVSGTVQFLNISTGPAGIPIEVEILNTQGQLVQSIPTVTQTNGNFSVGITPASTRTIAVDGATFLRRVVGTYPALQNITGLQVVLANGDVNGDGVVDGNDINGILGAFGEEAGSAGYVEAADLNRDDVIDGNDINVALGSFGQEDE